MMTASKFYVTWCYTDGKKSICRALHSAQVEPCIEAARLINGNPYASDIGVFETDSGKRIDWEAGIGIVLVRGAADGSIQAAKEAVEYSRTPFAKEIAKEKGGN